MIFLYAPNSYLQIIYSVDHYNEIQKNISTCHTRPRKQYLTFHKMFKILEKMTPWTPRDLLPNWSQQDSHSPLNQTLTFPASVFWHVSTNLWLAVRRSALLMSRRVCFCGLTSCTYLSRSGHQNSRGLRASTIWTTTSLQGKITVKQRDRHTPHSITGWPKGHPLSNEETQH